MKLIKQLTKDLKWTSDLFTGRRGLSASDRSEIEACGGGKLLANILYYLWSRPKKKE